MTSDSPPHSRGNFPHSRPPDPDRAPAPTALPPVPIIADTGRYVVVDKPAGLLSAPGKDLTQPDCVRARIQQMYPEARGPMTVHRLDMDTSGLLLVALDAEAHRALSMMLERRRARKTYIAVLDGLVGPDEGEIDLPLAKDWANRPLMKVDPAEGRPSKTRFRVLSRHGGPLPLPTEPSTRTTPGDGGAAGDDAAPGGGDQSLAPGDAKRSPGSQSPPLAQSPGGAKAPTDADLARPLTRIELTPITGRSHQLRVHTAIGLGCPVLGDRLYGDPSLAPRLMLHASRLAFTDPLTGRDVVYESVAPF